MSVRGCRAWGPFLLVGSLLGVPAAHAAGEEIRLARLDGSSAERPWLEMAEEVPGAPGLSEAPAAEPAPTGGPSPFVAGLLSAILPGSGQLLQGQSRGWLYLGIETAAWFSYFALRNAGAQAEEDFQDFADVHWTWQRYETVTSCGPGLGPQDFETEKQALAAASEDEFYEDIGREDVYACGWDDQGNRSEYETLRDDSDSLYGTSHVVTGVLFVNHTVSALDAARSAGRRTPKTDVGVRVAPRDGDLALALTLDRRF